MTLLSVVVEDPGRLPDALAAITRERAAALRRGHGGHEMVNIAAAGSYPMSEYQEVLPMVLGLAVVGLIAYGLGRRRR